MKKLLSVREASRLFGVHPNFFYDRTTINAVPCYRLGNLLRFDEAELRRFFKIKVKPKR